MVVAANFVSVAARMSLVTFLGIYFVRQAGIDIAVVGAALLLEHGLRGALSPMFGALSDRIGRRVLLLVSAVATAAILPCFLLVTGPASLFAWSTAMGVVGAVNIPVSTKQISLASGGAVTMSKDDGKLVFTLDLDVADALILR